MLSDLGWTVTSLVGHHGFMVALFGEQNASWTGDNATYGARHQRLNKYRGRAAMHLCDHCGKQARHWAQLHETSGLDIQEHYIPLCASCHLHYDRVGESNGHINRTEYPRGEDHVRAKVTEEQVREMREIYDAGLMSQRALGRKYGISGSAARLIVLRLSWAHV